MHNVLQILKRDILRLLKAPAALIVILALFILPSAYTWYNVKAFWNPYDNTGNLRVCIVSEDEGTTTETTGQINAGSLICEAIDGNDQLAWVPTTREDALKRVESGDCYAAFIIPKDFSRNLLSMLSGTFTQPTVEYYVNEKLGPVSPKITDTGATTLDYMINSTFVSKVSEAVMGALAKASDETHAVVAQSGSKVSDLLASANAMLIDARGTLDDLAGKASDANGKVSQAREILSSAKSNVDSMDGELDRVVSAATALQQSLQDASTHAQEKTDGVVAELNDLASLGGAVGEAAQQAISSINKYSQTLFGSTIPAINEALGTVSTVAGSVKSAEDGQRRILDQVDISLRQLGQVLSATASTVEQTGVLIEGLSQDLSRVRTDVSALSNADAVTTLADKLNLNSQNVTEYIGAPTRIVTEKLFAVNSYGAGMAPLFMNLTSWVGAFMIIVVLRTEVDEEGLKKLTIAQRYMGRFFFFAGISALQGLVCAIGVLALGVHAESPIALVFAAVLSSVTYSSVIFALVVTMQHLGKGLCFLLVFLQIPGATGLYPLELMPAFFQAIYRFLPFTYGIDAMREAISGFYGWQYLEAIVVLFLFLAVSLVAGIVVRPLLANANRMFAEKVDESGVLVGEEVEVPEQTFRLSQLVKVALDKDEFRKEIAQKYMRMSSLRPRIARWTIIIGVLLSVVAFIGLSISSSAKVILLTIWLAGLVALAAVVIVAETISSRLERQLRLDELEGESLRDLYEGSKGLFGGGAALSGNHGSAARAEARSEEAAGSVRGDDDA